MKVTRLVVAGILVVIPQLVTLPMTVGADRATFGMQQSSPSGSNPTVTVQRAQKPRSQIRTVGGMPASLVDKGNGVVHIKPGYKVRRISNREARVIPVGRQSTGSGSTLSGEATIKCDPCKAQGSCPLKFSEGKIWCEHNCQGGGCITSIVVR